MRKISSKSFKLLLLAGFVLLGWTSSAYSHLASVAVVVNNSPAEFYTDQLVSGSSITITVQSTAPAHGFGLEPWMTVKIALVTAAGTTPISNALSVSNVNFTTGAVTFNPTFRNLRPFTGSSVRYQVTVSSPDGTVLPSTGSANPIYSAAINIYDMESVAAVVNKTPAEFYTDKIISTGDVAITINPSGGGVKDWMQVRIDLVSSAGTTPISNALSTSTLGLASGTIFSTPTFKCLQPFASSSVRFQVTVSSANGSTLVSKSGTNPAYTSAFSVYDLISSSVQVNKTPTEFFTGRMIQTGDVTITVNSTSTIANSGMEGWMTATIALVSASGSTPISNALSISNVDFATGTVVAKPTFRLLAPFTGSAVRFQVTLSSANNQALVPRSGINPSYSSAFDVYDYISSSVQVHKSPADFFTAKNANGFGANVQVTINSTDSLSNFGLESWMRAYIAVVPVAGSGAVGAEVYSNPLNLTAGSVTYTPTFSPTAPHTGSSVRFQVTITSSNSTTPLTPKTGTNPSFSSAINIYEFVSGSAAMLRSPADFFTGKNANQNVGMNFTVVSTEPTTAPTPFGLEVWMRAYIAVAPAAGSTSISNEVRPAPLGITTGSQLYTPNFYPEAPHTGSSVRYQVTITSAGSTTALVPQTGTNPFFTTAVNLYDFVLSTPSIVQQPDPTSAKFKVDDNINPNPYGFDLLIRSTEPAFVNFGPESHYRVKIELIDFNDDKLTGGISQEDFVPGIDFAFGSPTNYPIFSPRYASYSKTMHFLVTVSSANGQLLIPQTGVNPSTTTLFTINAGTPSKFLLLPEDTAIVRPDLFGRAVAYDSGAPFSWMPTDGGEGLRVKVAVTDRWSNPVDLPDTPLIFSATQYLTTPPYNTSSGWALDGGLKGTQFLFDIRPWDVVVPITVTSTSSFASDTIYVRKFGMPKDTIFAGPSPFNPKIGDRIRFGFRVDQDQSVNILVVDLFGRKVWETSVSALADVMNTTTFWDGRNGNGDLVAAGVYFAVLEKGGEWKSKRKFGVIK